MNIPTAVPQNWLSRAKIRIAPIDDAVVADEQRRSISISAPA